VSASQQIVPFDDIGLIDIRIIDVVGFEIVKKGGLF
jgi:hypothetical protein